MNADAEPLQVGCLQDTEIEEAFGIKIQYLDDTPFDRWNSLYTCYPSLFVRCRTQTKIVGICYGWLSRHERCRPGTIILHGIAVIEEYAGNGYGSRLLRFFEHQVREAGYSNVSLGSAGGYVDHFYIKNGYMPVAFLISMPADHRCSQELRTKHGVVGEQIDGDVRRLYVEVNSLDGDLKRRLVADFQTTEVVSIMDKSLTDLSPNPCNWPM